MPRGAILWVWDGVENLAMNSPQVRNLRIVIWTPPCQSWIRVGLCNGTYVYLLYSSSSLSYLAVFLRNLGGGGNRVGNEAGFVMV